MNGRLAITACVVTFAGGASAASAAPAKTVVLGHEPTPVGMIVEEQSHSTTTQVTGAVPASASRTRHKVVEVIARTPDFVTKAKVLYVELTGDLPSHDAIVGHPYLVERVIGGALAVSRVDGTSLTAAERALVEDDERELGRPDHSVLRGLVGRPMVVGVRTEVAHEELQSFTTFPQPVTVAVTLTASDGVTATFAMEVKGGSPTTSDRVTIDSTGVVEIKTGRLLEAHHDQAFTHGGVSGTMTQASTYAYRAPAAPAAPAK